MANYIKNEYELNGMKDNHQYEVVDVIPDGYYYVYTKVWQNEGYVPLFRKRGNGYVKKDAKAIRVPDKGFAQYLQFYWEQHGAISRQWFEILLSQHNRNRSLL